MVTATYIYVLLLCIACGINGSDGFVQYEENHVEAARNFKLWQIQNKKQYGNPLEEARRYRIFHENTRLVNKLNRQFRHETVFALNQFGDLTSDEFRSIYLMPNRKFSNFPNRRYKMVTQHISLPTSFDWKLHGKVTSVKNQGPVGSCWAFSAVENIEGQWAMKGHPLTNLSIEQVVDCDDSEDIPKKRADCGNNGGWPYLAYGYVKRAGGLAAEKDYPYCSGGGGAPGTCYVCPTPKYNKTICGPPAPWCNMTCGDRLDPSKFVSGLRVRSWRAMPQNETQTAQLLMQIGPLSAMFDASKLQFYHDGIFNPWFCSKTGHNHAVLLTGFGSKKTIFGFKEDYWIVKNSFGQQWGKNGYFWIKRGTGACGINKQVTTAILE